MKYTRGQFSDEYFQIWESGSIQLLLKGPSVYFINYRTNLSQDYSKVSVNAKNYHDALERACFIIANTLSLHPEDIDLHSVYDIDGHLLWSEDMEYEGFNRREFLATFGAASAALFLGFQSRQAEAATTSISLGGSASGFTPFIDDVFNTYTYTGNGVFNAINNDLKLGSTGQWKMYKIAHTSRTQHTDIKTDASGNIYVSGTKMGTPYKPYLIKYDSSFNLLWHKEINVAFNGSGGRIAIDGSGNVYFATSINRADGESIGTFFKFDSTGTLLWQRELNTAANRATTCSGLAVDGNGDVYAAGTAQLSTSSNGYIIKLNSNGALQWQKSMANTGVTCGQIAADANNNIYVPMLTYDGSYHSYGVLQKFDSSGTLSWQRTVDFPSYGGGFTGVVLDGNSNIYVQGQWNAGGPSGVALVKYNNAGTLQYKRHLSYGSSSYEVYSESNLSFTTDGTYLYGTARSNFQAANIGTHTSLFKLNTSDGSSVWQKTFYDLNNNVAFGTTIISSDNTRILCGGSSTGGSATRRGQLIASLPVDNTILNGKALFCLSESASMTNSGTQMATTNDTSTGIGASSSTHTLSTSSFTVINASDYTLESENQNTLTGSGGMVWTKCRSAAHHNYIQDTVQGSGLALITNSASGSASGIVGRYFNTNGFTLNNTAAWNEAASTFVSWTFRKAQKFFDVVTYTGDGIAGRTINHSLGEVPGMIIVKVTSGGGSDSWVVWHRSTSSGFLLLNSSNTMATFNAQHYFGNGTVVVDPTASVFTVGTNNMVNTSGATYIAYLFAHDSSANGIIQCGSFTTDASGNASVNLGWEPQYVLTKATNVVDHWRIADSMRGMRTLGSPDVGLFANTSDAEFSTTSNAKPNSTGFHMNFNGTAYGNKNFIYLTIRRPNKPPTSGTQVFNAILRTGTDTAVTVTGVGFPPDLVMSKAINVAGAGGETVLYDRVRGDSNVLYTSAVVAEQAQPGVTSFVNNDGFSLFNFRNVNKVGESIIHYIFRRAPGFMDIVCDTGTGIAHSIAHNLSATPELIIRKSRGSATQWEAWHSSISNTEKLVLNSTAGKTTDSTAWNSTTPTSSQFTVGVSSNVNSSGINYVTYLFATLPGISKVGSYTGNGNTQTISCGFTSGARFIFVKRSDTTGDWYVWDTVRGISTGGNDPYFRLNADTAAVTTDDSVDADSTGFTVKQSTNTNINVSGGSYIFLAIS